MFVWGVLVGGVIGAVLSAVGLVLWASRDHIKGT